MAARTCSLVGRGVAASSAVAETTCPAVQNPHCNASSSTNARCSADSAPSSPRPSIVVTAAALGLLGAQDAREHRAPVDEHGAGAARALGAGDLRPGEADLLAQQLGQRRALGHARLPLAAVQRERDLRHPKTVSA